MTLHLGDCIEVMATMPADSVDAIVTDPPYNLAFMGRKWDAHPSPSKFQAWCQEWGTSAFCVTKPGGYLLAFGGTRTHHRLVCGLEDAGWIIRDELDWIYASGFPKGKANLKPAHEPIVLARKPGPLRPLAIDECRIAANGRPHRVKDDGEWIRPDGPEDFDHRSGMAIGTTDIGRWPSNVLLSSPELFDEPNPGVVGSGAISEDGVASGRSRGFAADGYVGGSGSNYNGEPHGFGGSGGYSRFFLVPKADRTDREPVLRGQLDASSENFMAGLPDPRMDRPQIRNPRENGHPTVKPVDLMRHLVRLVTPAGGTVLDCFAGSGSTLIAAELEGFPWIGIEKEAEYVAIAEARLNGTQRGLGLDVPAPTSTYRPPSKMPPIKHDQTTEGHWGWFTPDEEPAA